MREARERKIDNSWTDKHTESGRNKRSGETKRMEKGREVKPSFRNTFQNFRFPSKFVLSFTLLILRDMG